MPRVLVLLVCCLLAMPVPARGLAVPADDPDFAAGRALLGSGDYAAAHERLFSVFLRYPDQPEVNFLLGRAAFEMGDHESALMAYDRVLIVDPSAMRVRLEMARCYLALGNLEAAHVLLLEVLNADPPDAVRNNIHALLGAIAEQNRPHSLHGSFSAGWSRDDNARVAPVDDTVGVFLDNTVIPTTAERPAGDNIFASTLVLDHIYKTGRRDFLWRSALVGYQSVHQFEDDLDVTYVSLRSGPFWQKRNYSIELHPLIAHLDLDQHRYLGILGGEAVWSWLPRADFIHQAGFRLESKRYYLDHERDAVTATFFLNEYLQIGATRFKCGLSASFENAENEIHSRDAYGIGLRIDHDFTKTITGHGSVDFTKTRYDAAHPLFQARRVDEETVLAVGARKLLWKDAASARQLLAEVSHAFTSADSNIALYTYDKNLFSLLLTLTF